MSRTLRLKCPACQTLIETAVENESRITLQCAACQKQFSAKVPPRAGPVGPGQATGQSRPVVAARPVAVRPVAVQPAAPLMPPSPPVDPLFNASTNFNFPTAASAYQPVRKRKPVNLRPYIVGVGGLFAALLIFGLGLFGWNWVASTDWSTFRVVPDTHEQLEAEWFARNERTAITNTNMLGDASIGKDKLKQMFQEQGRWSENMLVRSVRLNAVPFEKLAAFEEKRKALDKKTHEALEAKMAALKAANPQANPQPNQHLDANELLEGSAELRQAMVVTFAFDMYFRHSVFDLPAPTNPTEKIYYEEANLVHDYLKQLTFVRNVSQSKAAAAKIEALADKMMDLTVQRSKLPANFLERVPREYVYKDKGFFGAQKALIYRIRRDTKPDETLMDAVANFNTARDLLADASGGKTDASLRGRFADIRKARSTTTQRPLGDLFVDEVVNSNKDRELVVKPRREAPTLPQREPAPVEPTPVEPAPVEPKPVEPKPQPKPEAIVTAPPTTAPIAPPASSAPTPTPSSDSLASSTPPPGTQSAPPATTPKQPYYDRREQMMQMLPPHMRPNIGPPVDGQAMVMPARPMGFPPPPSNTEPTDYVTAEWVKLIISKTKLDGNELAKRLAKSLETGSYAMNYSNGLMTLRIKYSGDLDRVTKLIDFGKVTSIDANERTIYIAADK